MASQGYLNDLTDEERTVATRAPVELAVCAFSAYHRSHGWLTRGRRGDTGGGRVRRASAAGQVRVSPHVTRSALRSPTASLTVTLLVR
jgi:hypothetical protein